MNRPPLTCSGLNGTASGSRTTSVTKHKRSSPYRRLSPPPRSGHTPPSHALAAPMSTPSSNLVPQVGDSRISSEPCLSRSRVGNSNSQNRIRSGRMQASVPLAPLASTPRLLESAKNITDNPLAVTAAAAALRVANSLQDPPPVSAPKHTQSSSLLAPVSVPASGTTSRPNDRSAPDPCVPATASVGTSARASASASASIAPVKFTRRMNGSSATSQRAKVRTLSPVRLDVTNDNWKAPPLFPPLARKLFNDPTGMSSGRIKPSIPAYLQHDTFLSPTVDAKSVRTLDHSAKFVSVTTPAHVPIADSQALHHHSQPNIFHTTRRIPPPTNDVYLEEVMSDPELELMPDHEDEPDFAMEALLEKSSKTQLSPTKSHSLQQPGGTEHPSILGDVKGHALSDDGTVEETLDPLASPDVNYGNHPIARSIGHKKDSKNCNPGVKGPTWGDKVCADKKSFSAEDRRADVSDKATSTHNDTLKGDVCKPHLEAEQNCGEDGRGGGAGECGVNSPSLGRVDGVHGCEPGVTEVGIQVEDATNVTKGDCDNDDSERDGEDGGQGVLNIEDKSDLSVSVPRRRRRRSSRNYPVRRGGSSVRNLQRLISRSQIEIGNDVEPFSDKNHVSFNLTATEGRADGTGGVVADASFQRLDSDVSFKSSGGICKTEDVIIANDYTDEAPISIKKASRLSPISRRLEDEILQDIEKRETVPGKGILNAANSTKPTRKETGRSTEGGQDERAALPKQTSLKTDIIEDYDNNFGDVVEAGLMRDQPAAESDYDPMELQDDSFGGVGKRHESHGDSPSGPPLKVRKSKDSRTNRGLKNSLMEAQDLPHDNNSGGAHAALNEESVVREEYEGEVVEDNGTENSLKPFGEKCTETSKGNRPRGRGRPRKAQRERVVTVADNVAHCEKGTCKNEKDGSLKDNINGTEGESVSPEKKQPARRGRGRPRGTTHNRPKAKINTESDESYKCTAGHDKSGKCFHKPAHLDKLYLNVVRNGCKDQEIEGKFIVEDLERHEDCFGDRRKATCELTTQKESKPALKDEHPSAMVREKEACYEPEGNMVVNISIPGITSRTASKAGDGTPSDTPTRKLRHNRRASTNSAGLEFNTAGHRGDSPRGSRIFIGARASCNADEGTVDDESDTSPNEKKNDGGVYGKRTPTRSSPRFRGKKRKILIVESEESYESPSVEAPVGRTRVRSEKLLQVDDDICKEANVADMSLNDGTAKTKFSVREKRSDAKTGSLLREATRREASVRFTVDGERSQGRHTPKRHVAQKRKEEGEIGMESGNNDVFGGSKGNSNNGQEEKEASRSRGAGRMKGRPPSRESFSRGKHASRLGRKRGRDSEGAYSNGVNGGRDSEPTEGGKSSTKRRKFMKEVLKLQKSLASAAWTDSREVVAQTEVKVIEDNIPGMIIDEVQLAYPVSDAEPNVFGVPIIDGAKAKKISPRHKS